MKRKPPFDFEVAHEATSRAPPFSEALELTWSFAALRAAHGADVEPIARRLERGPTLHREHLVELAGYGLAMVAVAVLMPGVRIVDVRRGLPPDLLFECTPEALRGVEVAARSKGGFAKLRAVRLEKQAALAARADVVEAHVSLWCGRPRVGVHAKIKP